MAFLEANEERFLDLTGGTSWVWNLSGTDVYPAPWLKEDFVEVFPGPFAIVSWLWYKPL